MHSITDIAEVIVSPVNKKTVSGELPVHLCNYTDVYYNSNIDGTINFMNASATTKEIEKYTILKGDVIITKDSETPDDIGVPAYVAEELKNVLCGYHLTILRPRKEIVIGKYLSYVLGLPKVKHDFYRYANGITRFGLTGESYNKIKVPIPSLTEQKAIASILETWDAAIEKTERLIAAKEKHFKWLLKTLINDIDYPKVKISHLAEEKLIRNNRNSFDSVLSVTNHSGFVLPEQQFGRRIASSDLRNYKVVKKYQYGYNPARINVGSIARLEKWEIGILSPMYIVFNINELKINNDFFLYWLKTYTAKKGIAQNAKGSVRKTVDFEALGRIKIALPNMVYQKKTATTLSLAKQEITTLRNLSEKYRTQKRGLMQKLLSGECHIRHS